MDCVQDYDKLCDIMHKLSSHHVVCEEELAVVGKLEHEQSLFYQHLMKFLRRFRDNPIFAMLDIDREKLKLLFIAIQSESTAEVSFTKCLS